MNRLDRATDEGPVEVTTEPRGPVRKVDLLLRAVMGLALSITTLLTLGALGSLFVFDDTVGRIEADFVGWLADNRVGAIDPVASAVSALSDTWTVIGVLAGSVSMLWVSGHSRAALTVVLGLSVEFITFLVVGTAVDRVRPDVEPLHSVPSTSSFPSGHTAAAFVLYATLVLAVRSIRRRSTSPALWLVPSIIAALVAAARVYEGVHYPSDVIAGFVLGVLSLVAAGRTTEVVATHGWLDVPFRLVDRQTRQPRSRSADRPPG